MPVCFVFLSLRVFPAYAVQPHHLAQNTTQTAAQQPVVLPQQIAPQLQTTTPQPPTINNTPADAEGNSIRRFLCSCFFLVCLITCYFYGAITFAKRGIWQEAIITTIMPLSLFPFIDLKEMLTDRLVVLESSFNIIILTLRIFAHYGILERWKKTFHYIFLTWFGFQTIGFCISEANKGAYTCLAASIMMGIGIVLYFAENRGRYTYYDSEGRALLFGVDASKYLQFMYLFWALGIVFIEYHFMPKMLVACLHFTSIVIAMRSGEFFRVRILTASHAFILNYIIHYLYDPKFLGENFAQIPSFVIIPDILVYIQYISLVGVLCILCAYLINFYRNNIVTGGAR